MKIIKPDFARRIEIPGIADPVRKPVDIDPGITGFETLRTLRIYQFEPGSVVDGHAEDDEVFLVVLSGSAELTLSTPESKGTPVSVEGALSLADLPCVAYLPPHSEYQLVPKTRTDVAYARATPSTGRPPKTFRPQPEGASLLNNSDYAQSLRILLYKVEAGEKLATGLAGLPGKAEALLHIRYLQSPETQAVGGQPNLNRLEPWDTIALSSEKFPGHLTLPRAALVFAFLSK